MGDNTTTGFNIIMESLIKSFVPIIYVVTNEETMVFESLGEVTGNLNQHLVGWSTTKGFEEYGAESISDSLHYPHIKGLNPIKDHLDALSAIEGLPSDKKNNDAVVFVMRDLHHYISSGVVIRYLKDIAADFRTNYKTLIILGHVPVVPEELNKDIYIVKYQMDDASIKKRIMTALIPNAKSKEEAKNINRDYINKLIQSAHGMTSDEIDDALVRALRRSKKDIHNLNPSDIYDGKKRYFNRFWFVDTVDTSLTFNDVGGLNVLKSWFQFNRVLWSSKVQQTNIKSAGNILICGNRGNGKSMIVKALSNEWAMPMVKIDMEKVMDASVSLESLKELTQTANAMSPMILWIKMQPEHFTSKFFCLFDMIKECHNTFFTVCTCDIEEAAKIPNVFDERFYVDNPYPNEMFHIMTLQVKEYGIDSFLMDVDTLSNYLLTGKQIRYVVDNAMMFRYLDDDVQNSLKNLYNDMLSKMQYYSPDKFTTRPVVSPVGFIVANSDEVEEVRSVAHESVVSKTEGNQDADVVISRKKLSFVKPVSTGTGNPVVDRQLEVVASESKMLDPHINPVKNLEVPGEVLVSYVGDLRKDFTPDEVRRLKDQFKRYSRN